MSELPNNWTNAQIGEIAELSPRIDKSQIGAGEEVTFVPMSALGASTGLVDLSCRRRFSEVEKGYTPFRSGDVLFAKITPCMENGKMAVVPQLPTALAFGSTEFHVLRPLGNIPPDYLYYFVSSRAFRAKAQHNMTGAVGQRRVPGPFLARSELPLPPLPEQHRIVAKIEELFSELDKGIENLKLAKAQLAVYRQALLKHAFEGKLTADWREAHPDESESAEHILGRVVAKRDEVFRDELAQWNDAVQRHHSNSPDKLPPKPQKLKQAARGGDSGNLSRLPPSWHAFRLDEIIVSIGQGWSPKCEQFPAQHDEWAVIKTTAIQTLEFRPRENKQLPENLLPRSWLQILDDDILITRAGPRSRVGIVCRAKHAPKNLMLCDKAYRLRFPESVASSAFMEMLLNTRDFAARIEALKTGINDSGVNITQPGLLGLDIIVPPLREQLEIQQKLATALSTLSATEADIDSNLAKSEALRQSILKKAFAGELVPQDPFDEPASELLARIRAQRCDKAKDKTTNRRRYGRALIS